MIDSIMINAVMKTVILKPKLQRVGMVETDTSSINMNITSEHQAEILVVE